MIINNVWTFICEQTELLDMLYFYYIISRLIDIENISLLVFAILSIFQPLFRPSMTKTSASWYEEVYKCW